MKKPTTSTAYNYLIDEQDPQYGCSGSLYYNAMRKKTTIGFLLATVLLVGFEYIILQELYAHRRVPIIIAGMAGVTVAAAFIIFFFSRYRKPSDES